MGNIFVKCVNTQCHTPKISEFVLQTDVAADEDEHIAYCDIIILRWSWFMEYFNIEHTTQLI